MNKEINNKIALCNIIDPVAITATTTSDIIDTQGFEALSVVAAMGAGTFDGSNYVTYKLQESDTTATGDFTDVASADLVGAFLVVNGVASDADSVQKVGYIGTKRYVRLVATVTATVSSVISATAILSHARVDVASNVAITATT